MTQTTGKGKQTSYPARRFTRYLRVNSGIVDQIRAEKACPYWA
jgi:hypothetical protein